MMLQLLLIALIFAALVTPSSGEAFSQRRRRTKELEEKIGKLDDGTKQRIYAMKASGMPHEAIAEKIAYQAGGKSTAKRIVDALMDDSKGKKKNSAAPKPKPDPRKTTTTSKPKPAAPKKPAGRR